jgi:hypothetical protein
VRTVVFTPLHFTGVRIKLLRAVTVQRCHDFPILAASGGDKRLTLYMENSMRNLFLAALAALSLGAATLQAHANDLSAATTMQQQAPYTGGN